jgi:hypothetical protein
MTHYGWKFFQIVKTILIIYKKNIDSLLYVIKPNFHGVEKMTSLTFHVNPKANNNQFSI